MPVFDLEDNLSPASTSVLIADILRCLQLAQEGLRHLKKNSQIKINFHLLRLKQILLHLFRRKKAVIKSGKKKNSQKPQHPPQPKTTVS